MAAEVVLPLLIGVVLFFRSDHIPVLWRIALLLPVVLFAALGLFALKRWLKARMAPGERSIWPDALALPGTVLVLVFVGIPGLLVLPLGCGLVVAFVALLRRRAGPYFAVFAGTALFLILFSAARLLVFEERLVLFAQHQAHRARTGLAPRPAWAFDAEHRALRLQLPDGTALALDVPRELTLHAPGDAPIGSQLPAVGAPVVLLSGSTRDPLATPLLAVFAPAPGQPRSPGDYQEAVQFSLGHRRSNGTVLEPTFEGTTEERSTAPQAVFFGIVFRYRRPGDGQLMRERLYVSTGPRGAQLVFLLRQAVTSGTSVDPTLLRLLRAARWESPTPGRSQEN